MNTIDTTRATAPSQPFGRTALAMPAGSPTSHETSSASSAISAARGRRLCRRNPVVGGRQVEKSGPKARSFSTAGRGAKPPSGSREVHLVPPHDVIDAEVRRRVLTLHLVVPGVVDLLVRDGDERRVLL